MSDWLVRPDPSSQPGQGVWSDKRLHDGERGSCARCGRAFDGRGGDHRCAGLNSLSMDLGLCSHGLNPKTCLQCFHAASQARPTSQPKPKSATASDAVVAAVRARTNIPGNPAVPAVSAPVHVGVRPNGEKIEPPKPSPKVPMPVPVLYPQGQQGGQGQATKVLEPFSYAQDQGREDSKGIWHPPRRQELIDRLPRHPDAARK